MQFGRGSLVASPAFDGDFLFVVGVAGSCHVPQGSCNIDINFPELFLDGAHVASGLQINNVMGVTVGGQAARPWCSVARAKLHASIASPARPAAVLAGAAIPTGPPTQRVPPGDCPQPPVDR